MSRDPAVTDTLIFNAAAAYKVSPFDVAALLAGGTLSFNREWLTAQGFTGVSATPEHQAYLAARWISEKRTILPAPGTPVTRAMQALGTSEREALTRAWEHAPFAVSRWWGRMRRKFLNHA